MLFCFFIIRSHINQSVMSITVHIATCWKILTHYPTRRPPSTVLCSMIFRSVSWRQTWPNHDNLRRLTIKVTDVRRIYWPVAVRTLSFTALCMICQASSCSICFRRLGFVWGILISSLPSDSAKKKTLSTNTTILMHVCCKLIQMRPVKS